MGVSQVCPQLLVVFREEDRVTSHHILEPILPSSTLFTAVHQCPEIPISRSCASFLASVIDVIQTAEHWGAIACERRRDTLGAVMDLMLRLAFCPYDAHGVPSHCGDSITFTDSWNVTQVEAMRLAWWERGIIFFFASVGQILQSPFQGGENF